MKKKRLFPDEENAKRTVERFEEENGRLDAKRKKILHAVSSHSRFLGNSIVRNPRTLSSLARSKTLGKKKTVSSHRRALSSMAARSDDARDFAERLKDYKYAELSRIVYEDVSGLCGFRQVLEEISDLAAAVVRAVVDFHRSALEDPDGFEFVVLGMGKLGGRLLNLSSDIDLIYIYRAEDEHMERIMRLSTAVTKTISAVSAGGFLYRVDLGLRPGGSRSPVAVSMEFALEHYFYWSETWERAVLLKASPIAGDIPLGREFIGEVEPIMYKKLLDYESIEDIRSMKTQLESIQKEGDVKLGRGGIREIEFFVQATQLMSGGAVKSLRGLFNTIDGLGAMEAAGFITSEVKEEMTESYLFLRKVEHNIQLWDELQTHSVPAEGESLLRLSRSMGFAEPGDFKKAYEEVTALVEKHYRNMFFDSTTEVEEKGKEFWELADFLTQGDVEREEAVSTLRDLGFSAPETAIDTIAHLVDPKRSGLTEKGRVLSKKVIPAFLSNVIKLNNPDAALINVEKFVSGLGSRMSVYSLLVENPEIISLLSRLFSRSGELSSFLIKHPEYLDAIILKDVTQMLDSKENMTRVLSEAVSGEEFLEDKLNALRNFKHVESLKLCFRELSGEMDPVYAGNYLSMVADVVMDASLGLAREGLAVSAKKKRLLENMVVLGLGKLGGSEMSYTSDLDIIFIYEGDDQELFSKYGQRFISNLSVYTSESFCYKIDMELRPSGKSGALVTSLDSFREYHSSSALLWEKQALVKARPAAGSRALGEKVMEIVGDYVYSEPPEGDFRGEIHTLRMRMEKELAAETESVFNIKTGRGGLVDVEFLVQMLQLAHGPEHPPLRTACTMDGIKALGDMGIIEEGQSRALCDGYLFLRKMGNILSLLNERSKNDVSQADFDRLSVEFGGDVDGNSLRERYVEVTSGIREIYNGHFGETP